MLSFSAIFCNSILIFFAILCRIKLIFLSNSFVFFQNLLFYLFPVSLKNSKKAALFSPASLHPNHNFLYFSDNNQTGNFLLQRPLYLLADSAVRNDRVKFLNITYLCEGLAVKFCVVA